MTIQAKGMVGSVSIQIKHHLWITWTELAITNERLAWETQVHALTTPEPAKLMSDVFKPSLESITAASHALDAVYGAVKPLCGDPVTDPDAARWKHLLETFAQGFKVGKHRHKWKPELDWLFDVRDAALHAGEVFETPVPHPLGGNAAPLFVTYSPLAATRGCDLLMDVLDVLSTNPGPKTASWTAYRASVVSLMEQRGEVPASHRSPG